MKVLIRRMREQNGTTAFIDRSLEAATLKIGRGTEQDLELADARVALAHAEITPLPGGIHRLEAKTPSGVWVNGGPCAVASLEFGDHVDLGRFRITLLKPPEGNDLALLVEQRPESAVDQHPPTTLPMRLQQTRLSRRALGWSAFVLVLLASLLLPLLMRYGNAGAIAVRAPKLASLVPTQALWSSGPLSHAHGFFADDCATCHVKPFEPVRNASCLSCHDTLRHHVPDAATASLPDFSAASCTDCHREHNGPDGTIVRLASLCIGCHQNLQARFPQTHLQGVRDFETDHPPFSPLLTRYDPATRKFQATQVSQGHGAPLQEDNGLIFPHDLHLSKQGVDAPEGKRRLECSNCHEPERGGVGFRAVSMERNCSDCHRLEFDPDDPTRVVPHGKPAEVAAVIRDHFAAKALDLQNLKLGNLPGTANRRRPGPPRTREEREFMARWSETQGDKVVREVFDGRLCRYCHVVQQTPDPKLPWIVAPVSLQEHTLSGAKFAHGPHAKTPCTDCHAALTSKSSHDVLLPDIEDCRACHGDIGSKSQVASACIDCHDFHVETGLLWDPEATKRKPPRPLHRPEKKTVKLGASP